MNLSNTDSTKSGITDPMEVLLNPEYLKKLRAEQDKKNNPQDAIDEVKDVVPDEVKEELKKQENRLDNELVQSAIDYIMNPMNSSDYRKMVLFTPANQIGVPVEDTPKDYWEINIPIFSTTF